MRARAEFRDRKSVEVAVLDALVDRADEGMTVFELRSHVGADIDEIEAALECLKEDDLIAVENGGSRTVIRPDDRVVPEPGEREEETSLVDQVRERIPFL